MRMELTKGPKASLDDLEGTAADLPELDLMVLRQLQCGSGVVAFQGLRHSLHVHQERLSRSLQRLESDDLVRRTAKGYEITPNGERFALRGQVQPQAPRTQVLRSFLPEGTDPKVISAHLEGRWFGHLRWLGVREGSDSTELRWVTDTNGTEVTLRISRGSLSVDTDAKDPDGMVEAFLAAQQIYSMVSGPWCQSWARTSMQTST